MVAPAGMPNASVALDMSSERCDSTGDHTGDHTGGGDGRGARGARHVPMRFLAARFDALRKTAIVTLVEEDGGSRQLQLELTEHQGVAIASARIPRPHPSIHELLCRAVDAAGAEITHLTLEQGPRGRHRATVTLRGHAGETLLDARVSDAVAIGARLGLPIWVSPAVFGEDGPPHAARAGRGAGRRPGMRDEDPPADGPAAETVTPEQLGPFAAVLAQLDLSSLDHAGRRHDTPPG
jgi:uncharacterized protein